jgi:hypothetical protein
MFYLPAGAKWGISLCMAKVRVEIALGGVAHSRKTFFKRPGRRLLLLLLTLPAAGQAQWAYTTNNGAITITKYTGPGGAVTIPAAINGLPVTSIGDEAFLGSGLTSVAIPDSVISIGDAAFENCYSLASVAIPDSVTSIGELAFNECTSLNGVSIGNGVTNLGVEAFDYCTSLRGVTLGNSITSIGASAFGNCYSLSSVCFRGNAPGADSSVFSGVNTWGNNTTVYYLPGTTNWGAQFAGVSAMLWNAQVKTGDAGFGVRTNRFGFTITGTSNLVIVVEACTDLANPFWFPVSTNTLAGGSSYFSDSRWTNYSRRFYRLRSP